MPPLSRALRMHRASRVASEREERMNQRKLVAVLGTSSALLLALIQASSVRVSASPSGWSAPWQSADVGEVGIPGEEAVGPDGYFHIAGAGSNIWGTADSFHFVYQPIGYGSIWADAPRGENTNPFAKVGLMIRQSLDPGSPHVIIDLRPDGSLEFMSRSTSGGTTTFINGKEGFERYTRIGLAWTRSRVIGTVCVADGPCRTVGTAEFFPSGGTAWTALAGAVVTSCEPSRLNHAFFTSLPTVSTVPPPWLSTDVGAVGQPGSAFFQSDNIAVSGAGDDIWGTSDAFHYVYQPINGDGEITTGVKNIQNTNTYAKAGVMFRESLNPAAATVLLNVLPDGRVEFMARHSTGEAMTFVAGDVVTLPTTLSLTRLTARVESLFIASLFDSVRGEWRQVGSTKIQISPEDALVGLAVTSHDSSVLNKSVFSNVQVVKNLLTGGDFERYTPPALGPPGWISDNPLRRIPAKSETNQPHGGLGKNGACSTTTPEDCGMYQEVIVPETGKYTLSVYATADRPGGLVGISINGRPERTTIRVAPRGFGNYGVDPYLKGFRAYAGDTIRIWMYSPDTPGFVVIDDVSLVQYFGPT